jgi:hypothetical protein
MTKRLVGEEYLRSILYAALAEEPSCASAVRDIDIFRHDGERANWDAALLSPPGSKPDGNCTRAFLAAKLRALITFDLQTDD